LLKRIINLVATLKFTIMKKLRLIYGDPPQEQEPEGPELPPKKP